MRRLKRSHQWLFSAAVLAAASGPIVRADQYTWIATDSSPNQDWSIAANWLDGDIPPGTSGDNIIFAGSAYPPYTSINDLGSPTVLNQITFDSTIPSPFQEIIQGNGLDFQGGNAGMIDNGTGAFDLNFASYQMSGSVSQPTLTFSGTGTGLIDLQFGISGTGEVVISGGNYQFANTNTFTGRVLLQDGSLTIRNINDASTNGALGNDSNDPVNLQFEGGVLNITNPTDTTGRGMYFGTLGGVLNVESGYVTATGELASISNYDPVMTKSGSGTLTLAGTSDNNSLTAEVSAGTLVLAKTSSSSVHAIGGPLLIDSGATVQLGGTGGDQIYTTVTVTDNGKFDLDGQSEGFEGLAGSGMLANTSTTTPSVLTVGENTQTTDSSTYSGGSLSTNDMLVLTKTGNGTLTLAGTTDNSSLTAVVNSGTLILAKTSTSNVHAVGGQDTVLTINNTGTVQLAGTGGDQIFFHGNVILNTGGTLDLNGTSEGFDGLSGGGNVTNTASSTTSTLTLGQNNNALGASTSTFSGTIADGAGQVALTKTGTGTEILSGINTYSGVTNIQQGILEITGGSMANSSVALSTTVGSELLVNTSTTIGGLAGGGAEVGDVIIAATDTLTIDENSPTIFSAVIVGTQSSLIINDAAATLTMESNSNLYTGTTTIQSGILAIGSGSVLGNSPIVLANTLGAELDTIAAGQAIIAGLSGGGTSGGNIRLFTANLVVDQNTNAMFNGSIIGSSGTFTMAGSAALTLTGPMSLSELVVQSGTLHILSSTTPTLGQIVVGPGATLDFGSSPATIPMSFLTIGGPKATGDYSILDMDIGPFDASECLALNGGASDLIDNLGGAIINITGLSGFGAGTYDLITFSNPSAPTNILLGSTPGGAFTYALDSSSTGEQLVVTATPEPATASLLLFAFLAGVRRRAARTK